MAKPARVRALSRAIATPWRLLLILALVIPFLIVSVSMLATTPSPELMAAWLAAVLGPLAFVLLFPSRVEVGADGIRISWLGRHRFIPLRRVRGAHAYVTDLGRHQMVGVTIALESGETIPLAIGGEDEQARATALAGIICDALVELDRRDVGDLDGIAARLRRGDQPMSQWLQTLRILGEGANVTLRDAPVDPEGLWRIAENPAAPVPDRAAAVVALRGALDDEGKQRLRVAAEASLEPRLRVVIDAATNGGDEAKLEAALGAAASSEKAR